uniref:Uncharacterized protein n=1 Tax=Acrochaetium secundatum TaxID=209631 RepID=A0A4D6BJY7_9FLOR|nr:hypothetical protein [Acrochaetium secundatum]QBX88362.1 hypothetical protein [Acrochaetium secundatum]
MTSSIFLAKNLVILFICVQSLEPCINDKILRQSTILTLDKLFKIQNTNLVTYTSAAQKHDLKYLIVLLDVLLMLASQPYIQKNIRSTLVDLGSKDPDCQILSSYMKRFSYQYYRTFKPYIIGYNKYNDYHWIRKISLINLVLLEQLPRLHSKYYILLYLLYNSSN